VKNWRKKPHTQHPPNIKHKPKTTYQEQNTAFMKIPIKIKEVSPEDGKLSKK
jgi:hypothetical protein